MAVTCARCGTQNPDGSAFCMRCGTPMAATPAQPVQPTPQYTPPPPGGGIPPYQAPPPGAPYVPGQSAYLPPPPGGTMVHRSSRNAVIAIVIVAVLVIAGGAVAFAALHVGGTTPRPHPTTPPHPTSVPSSRPTAQPTLQPTLTPTQAPTTAPTNGPGPNGSGTTIDAGFATVFVPAGWTTGNAHSTYIELEPPSKDGLIIVSSESQPSDATNSGLDNALLKVDQQQYDPSAAFCPNYQTATGSLQGSAGAVGIDLIEICENVTPQNGPAFAAIDAYADGIARSSSGLKSVVINAFAPQDKFDSFVAAIPMEMFTQTVFKDAGPP